jgi:hypothetical protein
MDSRVAFLAASAFLPTPDLVYRKKLTCCQDRKTAKIRTRKKALLRILQIDAEIAEKGHFWMETS